MSQQEALARRNLIIQRLRRSPCTFQELADYLQKNAEVEDLNIRMSKRTLRRDLDQILSLYGIDIIFDFNQQVYRIASDATNNANERILEAYDMLRALNLGESLSGQVLFEKRRPKGTEHFYGLLHAIKNHRLTSFTYEKYWEGIFTRRVLAPYALKEFKGRWYVVGIEEGSNSLKTFGLDRISELEIVGRFQPLQGIDVEDFFKDSFGIFVGDGQAEEIVLSFPKTQAPYIKSYPFHASQRVLIDNDEEFRIALYVKPTYDFIMELMAHHGTLKVVAPDHLRERITTAAEQIKQLYAAD